MSEISSMKYDVIIVGAGLAGCSAGIQLSRLGWKVLLLEQQRYPVHRLCGEFLSIEVMHLFDRLGVLELIQQVGAHPIHSTILTTSMGASFSRQLPGIALGLSRYQLDLILFQQAAKSDATCQDGTTVQQITGDLAQGFQVHTSSDSFQSSIVLAAFGKRSSLDSKLKRHFTQTSSPWIAFKSHCHGLDLSGTIEMHSFPNGYCGLSSIETGEVNLCWIGHQKLLEGSPDRNLPNALKANPALRDRLQQIVIEPSSKSQLSQISFAIKGNFTDDICMIGDAAGMITPLCGDGMAMALRTAEIITPLVNDYLEDKINKAQFKQQYQQHWQQEFRSRLQLGRFVHNAFVHPHLAHLGISACTQMPAIGDWLIRQTRGKLE
jgi:menaquinone-9 beta-reductase